MTSLQDEFMFCQILVQLRGTSDIVTKIFNKISISGPLVFQAFRSLCAYDYAR